MAEFDPYHKWLGIPKKDQPPHHYRLLGIDLFEDDPDVIDAAANRVMTYLQQCASGKQVAASQKILNEVAKARVTLLNPNKKARYDEQLEATLDRDASHGTADEPIVFASIEPEPEPDPLAFLEQPSVNVDLNALASASVSKGPDIVGTSGIPGWAVAFGLFVIVACCGLVGYRVLKETREPAVPVDVADDSDDLNSDIGRNASEPPDRSANRNRSSRGNEEHGDQQLGSTEVKSPTKKPIAAKLPENKQVLPGSGGRVIVDKPRKPAATGPIEVTNSIGMKFMLVPKGEFSMGTAGDEVVSDEQPRHRVVVTRSLFVSKFETTVADFNSVMKTTFGDGDTSSKLPITDISWNDASEFCRRLSQSDNTHCRLPTEAEWEYLCRAEAKTVWSHGDDDTVLGENAWLESNSDGVLHEVGGKAPNRWGLFDVHGNAAEWCFDVYSPKFYDIARLQDPIGPVGNDGASRVVRGGHFASDSDAVRCAARASQPPTKKDRKIGFRVVMEADQFNDPLRLTEPNPFRVRTAQVMTDTPGPTTPTTPNPMPSETAKKATPRPTTAPAEAILFGGNWYWFPDEKRSFQQALAIATARKGRLVAISSAEENEFVLEHLHGATLIGCARIQGRWMNSARQTQTYFNWGTGNPTNLRGDDYTIMFRTGFWGSVGPDTLHYAVEWGDEVQPDDSDK